MLTTAAGACRGYPCLRVAEITEISPGVLHWRAPHPRIGIEVDSYYLVEAAVALDPLVPEVVLEGLRGERTSPQQVLLTNRHHYRQADVLVGEFGCAVRCPEPGLHEFEGGPEVEGYAWGEELAAGITAHEVGAICPDDAALHVRAGPGFLALADGLVVWEGELSFVPDSLMDEPARVKHGLVESLGRLLDLDFDGLLFAHGMPIVKGGKAALGEFVENPHQAAFGI